MCFISPKNVERKLENKDSCGKALPYRNGKSQSVRGEIWREPEHTAKMAVKL